MKNFTKEYIREADCKEIQGLRNNFKKGDWYFQKGENPNVAYYDCDRLILEENFMDLWLLTGDQLDEEIVKTCKKKELEYIFVFNPNGWGYITETHDLSTSDETKFENTFQDDNPLIAKIKLLKELLNETRKITKI